MHTSTITPSTPNSVYFKQQITNYPEIDLFEDEKNVLLGIELTLFSYEHAVSDFETLLEQICGTHFRYEVLSITEDCKMTVFVRPREHCLVEGGMMYKSAGSIIKDVFARGFLIQAMNAIVD
jgi:hypothetical protein